ncbi:M16 family metallopeptidase [Leptodesmis sp.]|uniref:M16 family metallopeptidase n=1 Tax=Leptodesmis sp. TaxID=3100501 RepID=UPI0040535485
MTATLLKSSSVTPLLIAPTVHRLSNGLTIIAEQMPIDAVNLNIWLKVGSAMEADAINGMAHFLEHMVFKGTDRLQSGEFEQQIEQRGAVTNAATSQDYTHYYITTAPKDFADLAPLQVDAVMNARIPDDGFERERHVVLEEIRRSHDNPRRRTFQHATELAFERLPYRRQVLGPATVIETLTPQQMRDFHAYWYHPQAITAAVVGNLPVEKLIQIVEDSFGRSGIRDQGAGAVQNSKLKTQNPKLFSQSPTPSHLLPESPFTQIVRREVIDDTLQQARLVMTWRVPGMNQLQETYGLDVLASVLGRGRTSRLVRDLREERGLVSSISASNMTYLHQGVFYISAHLPSENLKQAEAAIAQHIRKLQDELISGAEIARVRTRTANHFIFGNETPSDRSGLYGYYHTLLGDLDPAIHYPDYIQACDAEELQASAQRYLSPEAYGIVTIQPGR